MTHTKNAKHMLLGLSRIALGWIFIWPFFDKLFGLGYSTVSGKAWLDGASPTAGFLTGGTHGPLAGVFQAMAGSALVDWLFMIGLLCIGLSLILGIGVKVAAYSGSLLLLLMWLAAFPPKTNPLLDQHIIYILILLVFARIPVGQWLGLGKWWSNTALVKNHPGLQ